MIGGMPYTDHGLACVRVSAYLKDFPAWPQLPIRSNLENMYIQFSEGFPGIVIDGQKISVDQGTGFHEQLEKIYEASARGDFSSFATGIDYASGLHAMVARGKRYSLALKGQMTGPISWGLCVTDDKERGILYDESLADALSHFLKLKAAWQEAFLRTASKDTIIFIDEPYLSSLGSAFVAISNDHVSALLGEVLSGISGIKGIHCFGGTNWKLLLDMPIDILSFDAYNYSDSLACYQEDVEAFIRRGSGIAWGIVPNDEATLAKESLASIFDRFGEALAPYTRSGITFKEIITCSLVTPTCALNALSPEAVEVALELLIGLSERIDNKYVR